MTRRKYAITTFGCRLNQFDSDAIERRLVESGWQRTLNDDQADVHIVNTCTITHAADADARQMVRRIARDSKIPIAVTGCYATGDAKTVAELPNVKWVVGNPKKSELAEILNEPPHETPDIALGEFMRTARRAHLAPNLNPNRRRVYLKIQDGCNYSCSFCIVPKVRGPSESIPIPTLVEQLQELIDAGASEVVLTGVHLGTYGRDLRPRKSLVDLLDAMLPYLGETRVRMGSLDPHEVNDDLIDLMAENQDRICRYLHLPVQSGDNGVLRNMHRAHTAEDMAVLVPKLKQRIPGIGLGSDVIVGFPGEDDAAFQNTYRLFEENPVPFLHVFPYSKREGTAAVHYPDQVPDTVKKERSHALRMLAKKHQHEFRNEFWGREVPAIMLDKHRDGKYQVVSDNYLTLWVRKPFPRGWANLAVH